MRKWVIFGVVVVIVLATFAGIRVKNTPLQWKGRSGYVLNGGSPFARGLIAAYLFDEGAGLNYNSRINNVATQMTPTSGNPTWGPTQWGYGIASGASGGSRAVNFTTSPFTDLPLNAAGFTLVYLTRNPGNNVHFRKTAVGTNNAPGWIFQNNGTGQWIFRIQTSGVQCNGTSNAVFAATFPGYQVVWRYNGAGNITASNYAIYMNGAATGFASTTNGTGTYNTDASNPFDNVVTTNAGYVLVYNRALSDGEIRDLYVNPYAFMEPDPNLGDQSILAGSVIRHRAKVY